MHEIDMKNYNIRTDLVIDMLSGGGDKNGVKSTNYEENGINVTDIYLDSENILNKRKGRYITIAFDDVTDKDNKCNIEQVFIDNLKKIMDSLNIPPFSARAFDVSKDSTNIYIRFLLLSGNVISTFLPSI